MRTNNDFLKLFTVKIDIKKLFTHITIKLIQSIGKQPGVFPFLLLIISVVFFVGVDEISNKHVPE